MLAEISQIDFAAKEKKYHGWCRVNYQTEAESIFQSKKQQNTKWCTMMHYTMNGLKKEKSTLKLLMLSEILLRFKLP